MYRRYIIVGVVFFLLIGAYFVFFFGKDSKENYVNYYTKLVKHDEFSEKINGINLSIDEIEESNSTFTYIVTFDNVNENKENVKILILDEDSKEKEKKEYPSFGIISNNGYSIVKSSEQSDEKEVKGVNLTIIEHEKIDNLLIYFSANGEEQFVRINVSNYLN